MTESTGTAKLGRTIKDIITRRTLPLHYLVIVDLRFVDGNVLSNFGKV